MSTDGSQLLPTLGAAGLADALVATLKSDSAYCVGTAAGALALIGQDPDVDRDLIEASGAIPALVCVIKKTRWPSEPEKEKARFWRCARLNTALYAPACAHLGVWVGGWGGKPKNGC